jgi:hypothetical protein
MHVAMQFSGENDAEVIHSDAVQKGYLTQYRTKGKPGNNDQIFAEFLA